MMLVFPSVYGRQRLAKANAFSEKMCQRLSPGALLRQDEPLARKTTLRVGGTADVYILPATHGDLSTVLRACQEESMPLCVIGRGSNILIRDGGFAGVVVSLSHPSFSLICREGDALRAGAGAKLKQVAIEARNQEWAGFEFLEGIPGTIGGALRMNAGAMGSCIFELATSVQYMDRHGVLIESGAAEFGAKYRSCNFFDEHIALSAVLRGRPGNRQEIERRMEEFSRKRWSSQPAAPSAGCMFKNPPQVPAGKLIDELGLKGTRVGGARVSIEHGNFLVNDGSATAKDVIQLIGLIRQKAQEARGIELETEVQILGEEALAEVSEAKMKK